jgi:transcriptional regulator with XRE-family HTH domain
MRTSPTHVGRGIKAARSAAGLSQAQLADRIGVAKVTISHWETGHRTPSMDSLTRTADALGIPIATIFEGSAA